MISNGSLQRYCVIGIVLVSYALEGAISWRGSIKQRVSARVISTSDKDNADKKQYVAQDELQGKKLLEALKDIQLFPEDLNKLINAYAHSHKFCYGGHLFEKQNDPIQALSLINRNYCAVGYKSGLIDVWNIAEGLLSCRLAGSDENITTLLDLHQGNFASGSSDTKIKIWNVSTKKCCDTLLGHTMPVDSLALFSSGRIASAGKDAVRIWDPATGRCKCVIQFRYFQSLIHLGRDYVGIIPGIRSSFATYDVNMENVVHNFRSDCGDPVNDFVMVSDDLVVSLNKDDRVTFWNVHTGKENGNIKVKKCQKMAFVDNWQLLVGCKGGKIAVIDLIKKKISQELFILDKPKVNITGLAVLPDGRFIASCDDGSVHMFSQE
jgi:WD40 repeat protein